VKRTRKFDQSHEPSLISRFSSIKEPFSHFYERFRGLRLVSRTVRIFVATLFFTAYHLTNVSEVSNGFAYFLLTFAHEPVLALYLVVLDVEFDSLSNSVTFDMCFPGSD
jgi:catechol 2,3-dioxygenase-like lactoylglutathione lyase family enzyme